MLLSLIADHPTDQVAAHQQLGQSYLEAGEVDEARTILRDGIALAGKRGDWHAASEMEGCWRRSADRARIRPGGRAAPPGPRRSRS